MDIRSTRMNGPHGVPAVGVVGSGGSHSRGGRICRTGLPTITAGNQPAMNGFEARSAPMVVEGPWPG